MKAVSLFKKPCYTALQNGTYYTLCHQKPHCDSSAEALAKAG
jgi:hypothetical protein